MTENIVNHILLFFETFIFFFISNTLNCSQIIHFIVKNKNEYVGCFYLYYAYTTLMLGYNLSNINKSKAKETFVDDFLLQHILNGKRKKNDIK